jgi:hypothetical protein
LRDLGKDDCEALWQALAAVQADAAAGNVAGVAAVGVDDAVAGEARAWVYAEDAVQGAAIGSRGAVQANVSMSSSGMSALL